MPLDRLVEARLVAAMKETQDREQGKAETTTDQGTVVPGALDHQ
jgi:hypothetical protein